MEKSINEEHLSQPLQTKNKQFELAITFLNVHNSIFSIINKNNNIILIPVYEGAGYNIITIPPGADEIESIKKEIKIKTIEEGYINEQGYLFKIKPNFSTLSSIIETLPERGWQTNFVQDDTLRDLLGFKPK